MVDEAKEPTRLSKLVAAQVPCSRREAEQYITEGWVRVNGKVVEEPQFHVSSETVEIDPRANLQPPALATILLNKPARMSGVQAHASIAAATRWAGDTSGIRRVKSHSAGIAELLPLPAEAEGLCVFSQDGRIVRKLREDARVTEQELVAEVAGNIAPGGLERLCEGLVLEGRPLPPARVSWQSERRLRFAVKDIRPEVVPWMCAQVGLTLMALKRLRIGRIPMGGLPPGQWRYVSADERF